MLDAEGRVTLVRARTRNQAHRLIEELMVAANRAVAGLLIEADQPGLHRDVIGTISWLSPTILRVFYRTGVATSAQAPPELRRRSNRNRASLSEPSVHARSMALAPSAEAERCWSVW